jgi:hypothetical protein
LSTWNYLIWLTEQATQGLLWAWPVTGIILFWLVAAFIRRLQKSRSHFFRWNLLLQFIPIVISFIILVIGAIFACENSSTPERALAKEVQHIWAAYCVDILLAVQVITSAWLIYLANPLRLIAVPLQLLFLWCSFWASFIAAMSISGVWL